MPIRDAIRRAVGVERRTHVHNNANRSPSYDSAGARGSLRLSLHRCISPLRRTEASGQECTLSFEGIGHQWGRGTRAYIGMGGEILLTEGDDGGTF